MRGGCPAAPWGVRVEKCPLVPPRGMARLKPRTPASVENPSGFQHSRPAHRADRSGTAGRGPARPFGTVRPLKRRQRARTPALTPPHPSLGGPRGARWWSTRGGAQRASRRSTLSSRASGEPPHAPPPVRVRPGRLQTSVIRVFTTAFVRPSRGGPTGHGLIAGIGARKRARTPCEVRARLSFCIDSANGGALPPVAGKIRTEWQRCEGAGKTGLDSLSQVLVTPRAWPQF